jgi:hypothetical protein
MVFSFSNSLATLVTSLYMTKAELIAKSIDHCDSSYTIASTGKLYTAWSSINILVEKDLVVKYKIYSSHL